MSNVHQLRPKLTLNRGFVHAFLEAPAPCCALGAIEERKQVLPLVAIRPGCPLPYGATEHGFEFGHSVLGDDSYEIVHFAFDFRGVGAFHMLVNPSDLAARVVLRKMVEQSAYFVFAVDPDERVTAFKADVGEAALKGLGDHIARLEHSTTSCSQYDAVLRQFSRRPKPPGTLLAWVCRGDLTYLDLARDRMELSPAPIPSDR